MICPLQYWAMHNVLASNVTLLTESHFSGAIRSAVYTGKVNQYMRIKWELCTYWRIRISFKSLRGALILHNMCIDKLFNALTYIYIVSIKIFWNLPLILYTCSFFICFTSLWGFFFHSYWGVIVRYRWSATNSDQWMALGVVALRWVFCSIAYRDTGQWSVWSHPKGPRFSPFYMPISLQKSSHYVYLRLRLDAVKVFTTQRSLGHEVNAR